ncbi:MAG: DUF92 domain-containing protein [Gemmatimonadetes bacterium]|nr:DUF92 domain-containing protein [Gemmatimonadota bacterium]
MSLTTLTSLLLAAAAALAWLFRMPAGALATFVVLAVVAWVVADPPVFLSFIAAFVLITMAKLITRLTTGGSDVARWRATNFLYSAGPQVLAVVVARVVTDPAPWEAAALAGLAVVVSDTASAEVGASARARAYLITTLAPVPPGTDGGISVVGCLAGLLGSALFAVATAVLLPGLSRGTALAVGVFGVAGNALDSLLGASLQRAGRLTNEQVNGASVVLTMLAALAWP